MTTTSRKQEAAANADAASLPGFGLETTTRLARSGDLSANKIGTGRREMDDELLTVTQVLAVLVDVSKRTFYRWRETGRAPRCIRLPNGELRIYRRDLRIWLEQHREEAGV